MNDQKTVLACENLSKTFSDGELRVDVLKSVNLSIQPGSTLAIIGASGAGKSTLLHLLGGLDKPTSGSIWVAGKEFSRISEKTKGYLRNRYLGFVYQFHHLLAEFTALENVAMPLLIRGGQPSIAKEKSREMLAKVGLSARETHRVGELSGGERQRVAIGRALVTEPLCVLADEPTGNLDQHTADQVFDLMMSLNTDLKTSLIIVTHALGLAKRMNKTLHLEGGQLKSS